MNTAAFFIYLLNLPLRVLNYLIWRFFWHNDTP